MIDALTWVLRHRLDFQPPIRVVNLSLGHPALEGCATDPLCQAVEALWQFGLTVVVSAGNYGREGDGRGRITSPGISPRATFR